VTERTEHEAGSEARGSVDQGIRDLIERTFLVGMGAAALTKDRVQELVAEFVRRGQLSGGRPGDGRSACHAEQGRGPFRFEES
jgi:hypothetical protein